MDYKPVIYFPSWKEKWFWKEPQEWSGAENYLIDST